LILEASEYTFYETSVFGTAGIVQAKTHSTAHSED
jgi:hypothetical protein